MKCRLQQEKRQTVKAEMPGDYETAFTICHRNRKELARGSAGAGGKYAVSVDIACPEGYHPLGIWHSHPDGKTEPSSADIAEMKKLGLEHLCISVPQSGELRCHVVSKSS